MPSQTLSLKGKRTAAAWRYCAVFVASFCVAAVTAATSSSLSGRGSTGGVRVKLEANTWESDSFWPARETAEFLYSEFESPELFWDFFGNVQFCSDAAECAALTASQVEEAVFSFLQADGRLTKADLRALKLALAYRAYLPAVVSHSQGESALTIRSACANSSETSGTNAWGVLNGVLPVCSPGQLSSYLAACSLSSTGHPDASTDPICQLNDGSGRDYTLSPAALDSLLVHDYRFPSGSAVDAGPASSGWLVVFGTVGSPELAQLQAAARSAANSGQLRALAFRHAPTHSAATKIVPLIPGFGIALDIKNMEYKTIDDREVSKSSDHDEEGSDDPLEDLKSDSAEVNGIFFSRVAQRRPELATELRTLKQHLVSETAASASEVKVWNMGNLGVAAAQRVVRMSQGRRGSFDSALAKLLDLSQNFPLHAASLTSDRVGREMAAEVSAQRSDPSSSWHYLGVSEGQSALWVNGVKVGNPSSTGFDVHDVIKTITEERRVQKMFNVLPLQGEHQAELKSLAARGFQSSSSSGSASSVARIDVRAGAKGALHFFNNLEKDSKYKYWSRDIAGILQPSWQLPQIAVNFYTSIIVLDPATPAGLSALGEAFGIYNANAPIRIGICLTDDDSGTTTTEDATAAALATAADAPATTRHVVRLVQAAKLKYSHRAASTFLEYLVNQAFGDGVDLSEISSDTTYTVGRLVEIFAKAAKHAEKAWRSASYAEDATTILAGTPYQSKKGDSVDSPDEMLELAREFASSKGLEVGHVTLNGVVSEERGSVQAAMNLVLSDMRYIQRLVSVGKLRDGDNVLQVLLKKSFKRYQQDVLGTGFNSRPVPFPATTTSKKSSAPDEELPFFYATVDAATADAAAISFAVVSNWDTVSGVHLALEALRHIETNAAASGDKQGLDFFSLHRACLIDSGSLSSQQPSSPQARALTVLHSLAADQKDGDTNALAAAASVLEHLVARLHHDENDADADAAFAAALPETDSGSPDKFAMAQINARQSTIVKTLFKLNPGTNAVVTNGHLVVASAAAKWVAADFDLLAAQEGRFRTRKLGRYLQQVLMPKGKSTDPRSVPEALQAKYFAQICATLGVYAKISRKTQFPDPAAFPFTSVQQPVLNTTKTNHDTSSAAVADAGAETPSDHEGLSVAEPPPVEVVVVVDPISESAQRLSPVLQSLRDLLEDSVRITIYLNPQANVEEFPLQRYFRFAAPTTAASLNTVASSSAAMQSTSSTTLASALDSGVMFLSLPGHQVLTMKVETPEPWIVPVTYAQYDMDNLQLQNCGSDGAAVTLSLTHLLVTGSCDDHTHGQPPNGLQLQLGRAGGVLAEQRELVRLDGTEAYSDTLVMQNLGYYQLKANPGAWDLRLAGRSNDLYEIVDKNDEVVDSLPIHLRSFGGVEQQLDVRKRPGHEQDELLTATPEEIAKADAARAAARRRRRRDAAGRGGLLDSIMDLLGGAEATDDTSHKLDKSPSPAPESIQVSVGNDGSVQVESVVAMSDDGDRFEGRIHVFSLASGKVYERLLAIMMLSVSRRASLPVTFWLVENFLSPEFKANLPRLCEEFGYRVELITYKWPHWLRQQTEKQRIIWGYKILFLDVLFPLDLKKVIYVDADQVVRADLRELWDMDLQGHAYGYTPFCDSNKETLGFQFWRQGYWAEHLRGRPYHISALYVVDLVQFRRQAVGDQLRATYAQLSRDPNSLSNLDQDLPNYVQPQVPMFSLPQEWLWCESWCSMESKKDAKTIDLCNHPATKEPKLDMAKRIISGDLFEESWVELDALVAAATESSAL